MLLFHLLPSVTPAVLIIAREKHCMAIDCEDCFPGCRIIKCIGFLPNSLISNGQVYIDCLQCWYLVKYSPDPGSWEKTLLTNLPRKREATWHSSPTSPSLSSLYSNAHSYLTPTFFPSKFAFSFLVRTPSPNTQSFSSNPDQCSLFAYGH